MSSKDRTSKVSRRRSMGILAAATSSQKKTSSPSSTSPLTADSIVSVIPGQPYRLEFSLPGLPNMPNEFRRGGHYSRHRHDRKWQADLTTIIRASRKPLPIAPLERFEITAMRFSSSEPDFDGLVASFKCIIDGLRELKVLKDDKMSNTGQWKCLWFKAAQKAGFIRVCIQEVAVPINKYEGL